MVKMYVFVNLLEEKRPSSDGKPTTNPPIFEPPTVKKPTTKESPVIVLCKKNILLEIERSDTIRKVKSKIEAKERVAADQSILAFKHQVLDDNALIADLKFIHNETVLELFRKSIKIFYQTLACQLKSLSVKSMSTIDDVKDQIGRREGAAKDSFTLAYEDFELDDDRTLLSYGIHQCLTLQMNPK